MVRGRGAVVFVAIELGTAHLVLLFDDLLQP